MNSTLLNLLKAENSNRISCNEFYNKYKQSFYSNFQLFKNALLSLEEEGHINIIKADFDKDLFLYIILN